MTEGNNGDSGSANNGDTNSGMNDGDNASGNSGDGDNNHGDTVKYDTYRKVLGEKKRRDEQVRKLEEELANLQKADSERTEKELKDQNKWKEIAELREAEVAKLKGEVTNMTGQQQNAVKLDAFLTSLGSKLPKAYWGLVDIESIQLNPETNVADDMSVNAAVESFRKTYPEILLKKSDANLPADRSSGKTAITSDDDAFKKLPAKDRAKSLASELIQLRTASN